MFNSLRSFAGKRFAARRVASELRALEIRKLNDLGVSRRNIALIANLSAAR